MLLILGTRRSSSSSNKTTYDDGGGWCVTGGDVEFVKSWLFFGFCVSFSTKKKEKKQWMRCAYT